MTDAALPPLVTPPGLVLAEGESLRALFRPDLDAQLRYAESTLALTSRRLCWQGGASWSQAVLSPALVLDRREHAGLGELRIFEGERTLGRFFHTLAVGKELTAFADAFEA